MKTKSKKLIVVILSLCIIASLTACNDVGNSKEWVLTYEKWESYDGTILQQHFYKYDKQGKVIGETLDYGIDGTYTSSDFKYDNSGNVISKSEAYNNPLTSDNSVSYYTYTYNDNGTLYREEVKSSNEDFVTEYIYDDNGNVTDEFFKSSNSGSSIYTYELKYENDLCIQSEGEIRSTGSEIHYILKKYTYDKNKNMNKEYYYDFVKENNESNAIEVNGKHYSLSIIKSYEYEKLSDVVDTQFEAQTETPQNTDEINSTESENSQNLNKAEETRLSDSCDMLLCTGYDDDDYYELVANQIDNYPRSSILVGVIKNNKWLIELSASSPFLNEESWWKTSQYYDKIQDKFIYLNEGCFLMENDGIDDYHSIIYKPDTNVSFEVSKLSISLYRTGDNSEIDYSKIINKNEFVAVSTDWKLTAYNMKTGTSNTINGYFSDDSIRTPDELRGISDGLFFARGDTNIWHNFDYVQYRGFFDINGNMVIDLSDYSISNGNGYMFEHGKYTLTIKNENDVDFDITFDTSGEIISQEKSRIK